MATYSVNLELNLAEDVLEWQVKDLEGLLLEKSREKLRELFLRILRDYERAYLKSHREWDLKERWGKKVATLFGEMKLERYRVWDPLKNKSRYPLDEILGIKKWKRESLGYQEKVIEQAVKRSYRQSNHEVQIQTGVKRSVISNWHLVQGCSKAKQSQEESVLPWKRLLLPNPPEMDQKDPCEALGIDLDATYCRSWKTRKWEKDLNVRVAVLYRDKVRVGRKRWLLRDKQVVAGGPDEPLEEFLNRVTEKAVRDYGLHQKTKVVIHGDGDPWIRNYALQYFPKALYRLDPWHVRKKIREATGIKKIPKRWEEAIYGNPEVLIGYLKDLKQEMAPEDPCSVRVEDLISYLQNNQEGLLPSGVTRSEKRRFPRLYFRGSGTIERNIAWTVNDRFKLPRMSWSVPGLSNLLYLREKHLNRSQNQKQTVYPKNPGQSPPTLLH